MKIDRSSAVGSARPAARRLAATSARPSIVTAVEPVADVTTFMGVPEVELTPKVRAAMMALIEDVDRLRRELDLSNLRLEKLEHLADQDSLVSAANRRAFVRELSRIMSFAERYGAPSSILYFDLNDMKRINDTHGHAAGDAALQKVANVLVENVRESDVVGRLGGDEFGVILTHTDQKTANEKAAMLANTIAATPLAWGGGEINLTVAYGVEHFKPGVDVSTVLANADRAMYANKQQSRPTA
jgi:diguanylate cyclase (GGDEF)-like protein